MNIKIILLLSFFAALSVTACSPTDGGLISGMKNDTCETGCVDNFKAEDGQIYIHILSPSNPIRMPVGAASVDIGGDCYVSLYKNNYIVFSFLSGTASYYGFDINGLKTNVVTCINGKFNAVVFTAGAVELTATIYGKDNQGVLHPAVNSGILNTATINIIK